MQTAVIYARVSTGKQEEHGISLDMQVVRGIEYAAAHGLELVDTVVEAESAKSVKGRPGIQRVMSLVQSREVGHVITYKLDRTFRNTVEGLQAIDLFNRKQVALHVVEKASVVRSTTADDEFMLTLEMGLATRERRQTSERTKAALRRKKERGEALGGPPPYGYSHVYDERDGKQVKIVIENPAEQEIIKRMRDLRRRGVSVKKIINRLEWDGYKSRTGKRFHYPAVYYLTKDVAPPKRPTRKFFLDI